MLLIQPHLNCRQLWACFNVHPLKRLPFERQTTALTTNNYTETMQLKAQEFLSSITAAQIQHVELLEIPISLFLFALFPVTNTLGQFWPISF